MKSKHYKYLIYSVGLSVLMTLPVACTKSGSKSENAGDNLGEIYASYESPDKHYKIVVYRLPQEISMPGQSGDASGVVCLYDVSTGKLLERKPVEMVHMIGFHDITWSVTNVFITSFSDWKLP
jgi:hypothetical protein